MMRRLVVTSLLALSGLLAMESVADAQEIQLTGPLAGAPAVRSLRWHRNKRFELAPTVSFTLLDEYQRTIFVGAKLNYNLTDWLALGVWGAYGAAHMNLALTDNIEEINKQRWSGLDADRAKATKTVADRNASALSIGRDFPGQIGSIQWVFAPQITAVPFRGKLAIFNKVFVDTDLYFFGGPAVVGVKERANYDPSQLKMTPAGGCPAPLDTDTTQQCVIQDKYETTSRTAFTGTFGFGLTFFTNKWTGIGLEYRALPFSWNASGFDSRGGPPDEKGPDNKIDEKDRSFRFNQMVSISFNMYFPTAIKNSP